MKQTEAFLREYRETVLDGVVLPEALMEYDLESCLKSGERNVYLLRSQSGEPFVLKTQPAGRPDSLLPEFELLKALDHPQFPKAVCWFVEHGEEYFLREYKKGISLYELVMEETPPDENTSIDICISVCNALCCLHRQQPPVIHRDIKPQNIILAPDGICHLVDLGTARRYKSDGTGDTVLLGTRGTAPPEQFGYCQTDARSDIYGIGMLLRFLLTGSYEIPAKENASAMLRRLITRCTAFDPQKRFTSVKMLTGALRRIQWFEKHRRTVFGMGIGTAAIALAAALVFVLPPSPGSTVEFQNPLLSEAVRQELGLPEHAAIPRERLGEVTKLILCGQETMNSLQAHDEVAWMRHDLYITTTPAGGVVDLSELKQLSNLRTLILDYQQISDISPLGGLPLEYLSLCGNQVTDLSPLEECNSLSVLNVSQNPVRDGNVLSKLPKLENANLNQTDISSLPSLSGSALRQLSLCDSPIGDYTPLAECKSLESLNSTDLDSASLALVLQLTSLRHLALYHVTALNFKDFTDLQNLQELDISSCTYQNLDGLELLPNLTYLNLSDTGLTDITPLLKLPMLKELELRENPVSDFSPLLSCGRLNLVVLEETQREQAQKQLVDAVFRLDIRLQ